MGEYCDLPDLLKQLITSTEYYFDAEGEEKGPVTLDALRGMYTSKTLDDQTSVWHEGLDEWASIGDLPNLLKIPTSVPTPEDRSNVIPKTIKVDSGPNLATNDIDHRLRSGDCDARILSRAVAKKTRPPLQPPLMGMFIARLCISSLPPSPNRDTCGGLGGVPLRRGYRRARARG